MTSLKDIRKEHGIPPRVHRNRQLEQKDEIPAKITIVNGQIINPNATINIDDFKIDPMIDSKDDPIVNLFAAQFEKPPTIDPKAYETETSNGTVKFKLKGRGERQNQWAIVSLRHWDKVSEYQWHLGKAGYPLCYELQRMTLHMFVFKYCIRKRTEEKYIDHIDRNKLNNTEANLRLATPQENSWNKSTKTNMKGVKKISKGNYTVTITKDGEKHKVKGIASRKEAVETYNKLAEKLFGKFAALNEIGDEFEEKEESDE